MDINELFQRIKQDHEFAPPLPEPQIIEWESRIKYKLPDDVREFYRLCNGGALFNHPYGAPFRFVGLEEVRCATLDILGREENEWCPYTNSWYSICDVQDGNYVAADLSSVNGSYCWMIDCFHETYGSDDVIALSFSEFLQQALDTGPEFYWLKENFKSYGCLYDNGE